jgi:hypothetical protein
MRLAIPALTVVAGLLALPALAKLPAPSDDAKAKAAEAAAKGAWGDKVAAFQLCRAMDRTVDSYRQHAKAAGKDAPAQTETPPCADPGPFVAPPLEAAGAHSPATTATAPPSSQAPAAELAKPRK